MNAHYCSDEGSSSTYVTIADMLQSVLAAKNLSFNECTSKCKRLA